MTETPNPKNDPTPDPAGDAEAHESGLPVHLYVLLDRSGSMENIRAQVVGGFNELLASQQADGADARITMVQFDTVDIAHTVFEDIPVLEVTPMREGDFEPRGGTPLLDASARLIARATTHAERRKLAGTPEEVVFVTITDGHENASREYDRGELKNLIAAREEQGWTFVFMSAALDAYADARSFGYGDGSIQAFSPDAGGARLAFASLAESVVEHRKDLRAGRPINKAAPFRGKKDAEADRRAKRGDTR